MSRLGVLSFPVTAITPCPVCSGEFPLATSVSKWVPAFIPDASALKYREGHAFGHMTMTIFSLVVPYLVLFDVGGLVNFVLSLLTTYV